MENKIIWDGEAHPDLEDTIFEEIKKMGLEGEKSKDLIFHLIPLEDGDYDGPSVIISGDEETTNIVAKYQSETVWVDIDNGKRGKYDDFDDPAITALLEKAVIFNTKKG